MKRLALVACLLACGPVEAQYLGEEAGIHGNLGGSGAAADPTPVFDFDPGAHGSGPSQLAHTVPGFATMTEVIDCDARDHTTSLACDTGGTWTEVTGYGGGGGDITPGWRAPWTEDAATASSFYRAVFRAPTTTVGNVDTEDFIAIAVVRTKGNSAAQTLVGNYDSTGPTGWAIEMSAANSVRGRVNGTTFGAYTLPAQGEWNIYAIAVDHSGAANGCRFYVNGQLAGSAGTCPSASSLTTAKNTEIGGRSNSSADQIDGWFSLARMWTCTDCLTTTTAMDDVVQEMSLRLMGVWPSNAVVAKPTTHDRDYPSYIDIMADADASSPPARRWHLPVGRDWMRVPRWAELPYGAIDRQPRIEGYFPEPIRINIALRSVEFGNAAWTKLTVGDTTQSNPFTSSFGATPADTFEADRLLGDGGNSTHGWRQSITLEASSVYKVSAWVGWETGYKAYAWLRDNTTANADAHFELDRCLVATVDTGLHAMGVNNEGTAAFRDDYGRIPGGFRWCRIAITIDGTAATHDIDLGWSDADGSTTSPSTLNETIGVAWGFQVEKLEAQIAGEPPSSFIYTTSASAQRERDYLRFDDDNAPAQGQMECSFLLADSRMSNAVSGNIAAVPMAIEVDVNNYILLEQTGEVWGAGGGSGGGCTYDIRTGGVQQLSPYFCGTQWAMRDGLRHTMRAVYLPNDARLYVDGKSTTDVSDTSVTLPTLGSGNIAIGYSHVFATQWTRGLIERCRLYSEEFEVTYP